MLREWHPKLPRLKLSNCPPRSLFDLKNFYILWFFTFFVTSNLFHHCCEQLDELEKLIAKEIESRDRAERRLKNALKKLESLKLFDVSGSSVSSSSECVFLMKHDTGKLETRQSEGEEVSGISSIGSSIQSGSQEGSWSSVGTGHSHNKEEPSHDARCDFENFYS